MLCLMSPEKNAMYSAIGRPSIPSERLLCEQLDSNLLFSVVPRHGQDGAER